MYLSSFLLWAIGGARASGINIFCEKSKREEVADFFNEKMEKHWKEAQDVVWEEYGEENLYAEYEDERTCYDDDNPIIARVTDEAVFVEFVAPPQLSFSDGEFFAFEEGNEALERTLGELLREYPEISYEGYIGFRAGENYDWDWGCDVLFQCEISSHGTRVVFDETDRIYDFVGEALASAMKEDRFWEEIRNESLWDLFYIAVENENSGNEIEDDLERWGSKFSFEQLLNSIKSYSKWISKDEYDHLLECIVDVNYEWMIDEDYEKKLNPDLREALEKLKEKKDKDITSVLEKKAKIEKQTKDKLEMLSLKITEGDINKQIRDELAILALKITEGEDDINKQIEMILKQLGEVKKG